MRSSNLGCPLSVMKVSGHGNKQQNSTITCSFWASDSWAVCFKQVSRSVGSSKCEQLQNTLQGTNISHLWKRKIIFKSASGGDMLVPRRVFECLLVHLGYTYYRRLWKHEGETMKLKQKRRIVLSFVHNKDSKPWTLSCGQSLLLFPSIVSKSSFNSKEWFSHVFTTAGLRHINLFSSALGSLPREQNDTNWVSVGICGSCLYTFKNMQTQRSSMNIGVKGSPRGTPKEKESKTLSETDAICHLNMD